MQTSTETNRFHFSSTHASNHHTTTTILLIDNYNQLSCRSMSDIQILKYKPTSDDEITTYSPIDRTIIAASLVCPYSSQCPSQCRCWRDYANTFDRVNCSASSLKSVPSRFPPSVTDIDLSGNTIESIRENQFAGLDSLARLDLSNNQILAIYRNAFASLAHLKTLDLSRNRLEFLLEYELSDLTQLLSLDLSHNR